MKGSDPTWTALPVRARPRPTPAARLAAIRRLEAWAVSRGAYFEPLELGVDDAGNSTVRARRRIAADEVVVTIPRSIILSDADLAKTPTGEPDPFGGRRRDPRVTLAAWLALEIERADSPWRPFLDVLPVCLPELPVFHGGDELAPLAGTAARMWTAETHAEIVDAHASFVRSMRARVSLAAYVWGSAVVLSRAFNAPFTVEPWLAFIPIVDLMDHRPDETGWHYNIARQEYVVSAFRDFDAGEPVHFTYGDFGNTHLFVHYGFAVPDATDDETALVIDGDPILLRPRFDAAFEKALSLASPAQLGDAARLRLAGIAPGDADAAAGSWEATCALVRRGERRTLEAIIAFAGAVAAGAAPEEPPLVRDYRQWLAGHGDD